PSTGAAAKRPSTGSAGKRPSTGAAAKRPVARKGAGAAKVGSAKGRLPSVGGARAAAAAGKPAVAAAEPDPGLQTTLDPSPAGARGGATSPQNGSSKGSALSSAFEDAMTSGKTPSPDDSLSAPMNLEGEWYVAEGGVQSGPYELPRAKAWVRARPAGAELFCWTDGFDDWKPCADVRQFRSLEPFGDEPTRIEPGGILGGGSLPASESSGPLFADLGPASRGPSGPDPGHDLEIGEVSRVVRLPVPPPSARADSHPGLPGMGIAQQAPGRIGYGTGNPMVARPTMGGTGGLPALGASGSMPSVQKRHSKAFWLLLFGGGAAVVAMVIVLIVMSGSSDDGPGLRRTDVKGDGLGIFLGGQGRTRKAGNGGDGKTNDDKGSSGKGSAKVVRKSTKTGRKTTTRSGGSDEVDLGSGSEGGPVELTPDDVARKYRKNQFAINRCYERALKRDPFLEVKKVQVTVSVDLRGRTSAKVPVSDARMRACLERAISGWRFDKPKEALNTRLQLLFKSR
ncbi:MAG: DUF4339 domain-containing protein, partial [Deltaproteobacteria bacterium]|nr:DUF4339 domain-containing protein [Deltaproteobacteria bacterium]